MAPRYNRPNILTHAKHTHSNANNTGIYTPDRTGLTPFTSSHPPLWVHTLAYSLGSGRHTQSATSIPSLKLNMHILKGDSKKILTLSTRMAVVFNHRMYFGYSCIALRAFIGMNGDT